MVRISDILRPAGDDEEDKKDKKEGAAEDSAAKTPQPTPPEEKEKPPLSVPTPPTAKEDSEKISAEIFPAMKDETDFQKTDAKKIYDETLDLIKQTLRKAFRNEPFEGKLILQAIGRLIDKIALGGGELLEFVGSFVSPASEDYLYAHSVNICILSIEIGLGLGYNKSKLHQLGVFALLHDIGMLNAMDVLDRPRQLTKEESEEIKRHHLFYERAFSSKTKDIGQAIQDTVGKFRERISKSKYPKTLKKDWVVEFAKIINIAEVYETMTHPPTQLKAFLPSDVVREMLGRKELLDLPVLKTFVDRVTIYPLGSWIRLSTGEVGKVLDINRETPLRPKVTVIFDAEGKRLDHSKHLDLAKSTSIYVKGILSEEEIATLLYDKNK